jgi:hypothetical protein
VAEVRPSRFSVQRAQRWFQEPTDVWGVTAVLLLALGLRIWVAAGSHGTNDIDTWHLFARLGSLYGVSRVYELHPLFNHPPLMGWYAVGVLTVSKTLHSDFSFTFKLGPILADLISVVLVRRLARLSVLWLLLFAINPISVLVSAFHGNSDCLCAMFCVAGASYAGQR